MIISLVVVLIEVRTGFAANQPCARRPSVLQTVHTPEGIPLPPSCAGFRRGHFLSVLKRASIREVGRNPGRAGRRSAARSRPTARGNLM